MLFNLGDLVQLKLEHVSEGAGADRRIRVWKGARFRAAAAANATAESSGGGGGDAALTATTNSDGAVAVTNEGGGGGGGEGTDGGGRVPKTTADERKEKFKAEVKARLEAKAHVHAEASGDHVRLGDADGDGWRARYYATKARSVVVVMVGCREHVGRALASQTAKNHGGTTAGYDAELRVRGAGARDDGEFDLLGQLASGTTARAAAGDDGATTTTTAAVAAAAAAIATPRGPRGVAIVCAEYWRGLQWVLDYYYRGS